MAKFLIYINENAIGEIYGYEAAWDAYCKAVALCELVGAGCALFDAEVDEVIESFGYGSDDDDVLDDSDDMGSIPMRVATLTIVKYSNLHLPGRAIYSAPLPLYTLYYISRKMSRGILKIKKFFYFLNFY